MSSIGDGAGRGVFAKVDIPQGSCIAAEESYKKVHFTHTTTYLMEIVKGKVQGADDLRDLIQYAYGYGFQEKVVVSFSRRSFLFFVLV